MDRETPDEDLWVGRGWGWGWGQRCLLLAVALLLKLLEPGEKENFNALLAPRGFQSLQRAPGTRRQSSRAPELPPDAAQQNTLATLFPQN